MRIILWCIISVSLLLLGVTAYGVTQTMAQETFTPDELRFSTNDKTTSLAQLEANLSPQPDEPMLTYLTRLNQLVATSIAHIHWDRYEPERFHQQVPIWENWMLWFLGEFSGLPEFEKYHFTKSDKSIERGIGVCGDVSMLLSEILRENGIDSYIISTQGHVIVEVPEFDLIMDPDFGVVFSGPFEQVNQNAHTAARAYANAGYSVSEQQFLYRAYQSHFTRWDGARHFVTNKYYFERISYYAIWFLPILSIVVCLGLLKFLRKS